MFYKRLNYKLQLISPPILLYRHTYYSTLKFIDRIFIFEGAMPEKAFKYAPF